MVVKKVISLCSSLSFLLTSSVVFAKEAHFATLDWQPYIGQNLPKTGVVFEMVEAAYKAVGYTKVTVDFAPWARAVEDAKAGKYDGLLPEYFDVEREKQGFSFSDPFFSGPVGFLGLKSSNIKYDLKKTGENLDELYKSLNSQNLKFGVVRDYVNEPSFDGNKSLIKEEVNSDETNVKKLFAKRIGLIFIDKYVAKYFIKTLPELEKKESEFTFFEPAVQDNKLYIAFFKKIAKF